MEIPDRIAQMAELERAIDTDVFGGHDATYYDAVSNRDVSRFLADLPTLRRVEGEFQAALVVDAQYLDFLRARWRMYNAELTEEDLGNLARAESAIRCCQDVYNRNPSLAIAWMIATNRFSELHKVVLTAGATGKFVPR